MDRSLGRAEACPAAGQAALAWPNVAQGSIVKQLLSSFGSSPEHDAALQHRHPSSCDP